MLGVTALDIAVVDHHALVNVLVAASATHGSSIVSWGPLGVAAAGLITAAVAALARRDRRRNDVVTSIDARTNTALRGLEAYADRLEKERAAWQVRAEAAEARVEELEAENDRLESECERLRRGPTTPRRRSRPPDG